MSVIDLNPIRKWMRANVSRFIDECGEVNCTLMVETWDIECASGKDTLDDPDHPAWDMAIQVDEEQLGNRD